MKVAIVKTCGLCFWVGVGEVGEELGDVVVLQPHFVIWVSHGRLAGRGLTVAAEPMAASLSRVG